MLDRPQLSNLSRWVIKIGSSMLTDDGRVIDKLAIRDWAKQMAKLHHEGRQIVLVSSGAIAIGMQLLGWRRRPTELSALQTAAAVGQVALINEWQEAFKREGILVAQLLLTHEDAADRRRYLNIRSTLQAMNENKIIPIINENDTVSFEEIRFGDNDSLGAMVANISDADGYIILTDQQGMYDKNPREFTDATLLSEVSAKDDKLLKMAGRTGGHLGSGGMYTKVLAARKAANSGTHTILAYGKYPDVINAIVASKMAVGTLFIASNSHQQARKQWLGSQLQVQGTVWVDEGAAVALLHKHKSLLPIGIYKIDGEFSRGALLSCRNRQGLEIARGLSNYAAGDCSKIMGKHSDEVGYLLIHGKTFIHRDNLVLL